jgi:hypothetical protein
VCGDEVYGACTELREYLEDHDQAYVLRVPRQLPADGRVAPTRATRRRQAGGALTVILLGSRLERQEDGRSAEGARSAGVTDGRPATAVPEVALGRQPAVRRMVASTRCGSE